MFRKGGWGSFLYIPFIGHIPHHHDTARYPAPKSTALISGAQYIVHPGQNPGCGKISQIQIISSQVLILLSQVVLEPTSCPTVPHALINFDKVVKSLFTCHCEESFGYAQDKLHDETIS